MVTLATSTNKTIDYCRKLQTPQKTPDRTWYRLKTIPGIENSLCQKLRQNSIPCYYPQVRVKSETEFSSNSSMFPGNVFAALTENDAKTLSAEFLVEEIVKGQSSAQEGFIDSELNYMVFAERLNCFYPFKKVKSCPACPKGINGIDYIEISDKDSGYILAIPQKRKTMEKVYFRFDSVSANIEFALPQTFFVEMLNLK